MSLDPCFSTRTRVFDSPTDSGITNHARDRADIVNFIHESVFIGPRSLYLEYYLKKISWKEAAFLCRYYLSTKRVTTSVKDAQRAFVWELLFPKGMISVGFDPKERYNSVEDFVESIGLSEEKLSEVHRFIFDQYMDPDSERTHINFEKYEKQRREAHLRKTSRS